MNLVVGSLSFQTKLTVTQKNTWNYDITAYFPYLTNANVGQDGKISLQLASSAAASAVETAAVSGQQQNRMDEKLDYD